MSLEKKFSKIMDNYTFRGSYQELKKIVQAEIGDGVWNSLGQIKAFVSAKKHRELNWNPETGGILFVANLDRNWRTQKIVKPAQQDAIIPKRSWTTIQSGPHAGMSLPEVFLNSPWDSDRYCSGDEILSEDLERDLLEISKKITKIKIPNRSDHRAAVAHYSDSAGRCYGFEVIGKSHRFQQLSGHIVVQEHIDLTESFPMDEPYEDFNRVSGCLQQAFGDQLRWLDRDSCELFFNNPNNFLSARPPEVKLSRNLIM
jgi:hypothetical protein